MARFLVQVRWWGAGLVLAGSQHVRAQVAADVDLAATASIGVTDNVANTPTPEANAGLDVLRPRGDVFGTIAPSVRLQLETPGTTHTLAYAFGYTFNLLNSDANNYSNGLSYGLRTPVSEVTEMTLSLAGAQATAAALQLLAPAAAGQPQPNTGTNNIVLSGGGGLGFSTELSETVSVSQTFSGSYVYTLVPDGADTSTALASAALGLNKRFLINQLGFEQSNDFQRGRTANLGDVQGIETYQVLHRGRATWTHQFNEEAQTSVGAGIVVGYDPTSDLPAVVNPVGNLAFTYALPSGLLTFGYNHDATPNVLLAQVTLVDAGNVNATYLLPKGFDLSATVGASINRAFLGPGGFGPPTGAWLGDAAVGWVPATVPMRLELRYQFSHQQRLYLQDVALPTITRHSGLLNTTFAWPGQPTVARAAFTALPAPTASLDILGRQAPRTERGEDEETKKSESEAEGRAPPAD